MPADMDPNVFRQLLALLYRTCVAGPTENNILAILRFFTPGATLKKVTSLPVYSDPSSFGPPFPTQRPVTLSENSVFVLNDTEEPMLILSQKDIIYDTSELTIPSIAQRDFLSKVLRLV